MEKFEKEKERGREKERQRKHDIYFLCVAFTVIKSDQPLTVLHRKLQTSTKRCGCLGA